MIVRIWHGWTSPDNANTYEALLEEEIFVGIENRRIPGFHGIQLLRRDAGPEVEFVTIMQQEERILVVPGRGFGRSGYIRIAYCVPLEVIYKARPGFLRVGKRYTKKR